MRRCQDRKGVRSLSRTYLPFSLTPIYLSLSLRRNNLKCVFNKKTAWVKTFVFSSALKKLLAVTRKNVIRESYEYENDLLDGFVAFFQMRFYVAFFSWARKFWAPYWYITTIKYKTENWYDRYFFVGFYAFVLSGVLWKNY